MVETPLDPSQRKPPAWKGAAAIVGSGKFAETLKQRLIACGVSAEIIDADKAEQGVRQLEALWSKAPIHHLFITTAREANATDVVRPAEFDRRYQRGVLTPIFVSQRWLQLAHEAQIVDRCSIAAVTNLHGDFGFSGDVSTPESGALTGLMKSIYIESVVMHRHSGLIVKAIDTPKDDEPRTVIDAVFHEIAAETIDYEVSYQGGKRYLQNAYSKPTEMAAETPIRDNETWIVTGGARGITAESVRELAQCFGIKLHLIGTTPRRDIPAEWRNLDEQSERELRNQVMVDARANGRDAQAAWNRTKAEIEIEKSLDAFCSAGVDFQYHVCDVSDRDALAQVVQQIRTNDAITGIVHGAGIDRSCRFEKKTRENILATLGAKVQGAYNLMTLTWHDEIRHFIGFGSVSGRLGSNGQADYCAASDMLCKLISWYGGQRPNCRTIGFHFHPWDDVGMAATPETKKMLKATGGPALMPKSEGVAHFLGELHGNHDATEVLVTSREYYDRFYGDSVNADRPEDAVEVDLHAAVASPKSAAPDDKSSFVTDRMVVRMLQQDRTSMPPAIVGTCLIYGKNAVADALKSQLSAFGFPIQIIPTCDSPETLDRLAHENGIETAKHLFIVTSFDDANHESSEIQHSGRRLNVESAFWLLQKWFSVRGQKFDNSSLVVCTKMGGDFGIAGTTANIDGGGLAGLMKSIDVEAPHQGWNALRRKTIDFASNTTPEFVAQQAIAEIGDDELEVGFAGEQRCVVRVHTEDIQSQSENIDAGGTWVFTGGARGVTAEVALEFGKRFQLDIHLLGSSPKPNVDPAWRNLSPEQMNKLKGQIAVSARSTGKSPIAAWREVEKAIEIDQTLQRFRDAGVKATYHCCDVLDHQSLAETLERVRRFGGPIAGVVHGAGIAIDSWLVKKKPENISKTIAIKVESLGEIMRLTASDPVKHLVGFGSVSGRFGAKGQADYCAANDMMCKLINSYASSHPNCRAVGVHWHAWGDVGMAMKPELIEMFQQMELKMMPVEEGVQQLIRELNSSSRETEVVITEAAHYAEHYPRDVVVSANDPRICSAATTKSVPQSASSSSGTSSEIESAPMIDRFSEERFVSKVDPVNDPFLVEHLMGDRPFLPAVIATEIMAEAASLTSQKRTIELENLSIHNGLAFRTDDTSEVYSSATLITDGKLDCRLTANLLDRQGRLVEENRLLLTATAHVSSQVPKSETAYCGEPAMGWFPMQYPDSKITVQHGPKFRCLKNLFCQHDGGFGQLVAPPIEELAGRRSTDGWHLPPAVLDGCLVACSTYSYVMLEQRVEIPQGFDRLRFFDLPNPGEDCIVRMYVRGSEARVTRYDFTLFGADQRVLLEAQGYQSVNLNASRSHE